MPPDRSSGIEHSLCICLSLPPTLRHRRERGREKEPFDHTGMWLLTLFTNLKENDKNPMTNGLEAFLGGLGFSFFIAGIEFVL